MFFLSETNIGMHKEYLRELCLKLSIFEKTYPDLVDKDLVGILKSGIPKNEKEEAALLKADIISHKVFFDSFDSRSGVCEAIRHKWGSEASFLHSLYEKCVSSNGFLFIYRNKGGIGYYIGDNYRTELLKHIPILAVDLFEHSYFYDYGFNKRGYIQKALSNLNLSKLNITKSIEKSEK